MSSGNFTNKKNLKNSYKRYFGNNSEIVYGLASDDKLMSIFSGVTWSSVIMCATFKRVGD